MRKVTYAKLHGPTFVPGIAINLKDVLTDDPTTVTRGIEMQHKDGGLVCTLKGIEFFVPEANIQLLVYTKETPAVVVSKSK